MPLQVEPALEEDVPRLHDIEMAAFRPCEAMQILWPGLHGDIPTDEARKDNMKYLMSTIAEDQMTLLVKAVDTDHKGEIVAFALFRICPEGLPSPQFRDLGNPVQYGVGSNIRACLDFFSLSFRRQMRHIGDEACTSKMDLVLLE